MGVMNYVRLSLGGHVLGVIIIPLTHVLKFQEIYTELELKNVKTTI